MILCGLFCAGKSTIGRALATAMELPFYDTDQMLESTQNRSVSAIWREQGEAHFRDLESACVRSLKREPCVIATGGGTLLRGENRAHLKQLGSLVYLKAPIELLWERLCKRGIPAYLDPQNPRAHMEQIAELRLPLFEEACDHILEVGDLSVEASVSELMRTTVLAKRNRGQG